MTERMIAMIDLTLIIQALIGLCATLITAYLIPWLKEKAGREKLEKLYRLAGIAVQAAEQLYGGGTGDEKREYVLDYLRAHGFDLSTEELRTALEAAVHQMDEAIMKK